MACETFSELDQWKIISRRSMNEGHLLKTISDTRTDVESGISDGKIHVRYAEYVELQEEILERANGKRMMQLYRDHSQMYRFIEIVRFFPDILFCK